MSPGAPMQTVATKPAQIASTGLILQRKCACGGGASSLTGECEECTKKKLALQTKLQINQPGDIYEQEADRVADQVLTRPAHPNVGSAPPRIQRFSGPSSGQMRVAPASVGQVLASPGRPLEPNLRHDMEQRFGHDFSQVRVHSGGSAEQSARDVNARAYTVGHNVVFGATEFAPSTQKGRRLIAHELTHVVQQSTREANGQLGIQRSPDEPAPGKSKKSAAKTSSNQVPFDISFNHPLTRSQFIELAEMTIYRRRTPGEWTGIPDRLEPQDSPVEVWVPASTLGAEFCAVNDFLQSSKSGVSIPFDAKARSRIAKKLLAAGVNQYDLIDYREMAGGRPAKSWGEFEASIDRFLEARTAKSQKQAETTAGLESALSAAMSFDPAGAGAKGLDITMGDIYEDYRKLKAVSELRHNASSALSFIHKFPDEWKKISAQGVDAYEAELRSSIETRLQDRYDISGIPEFEAHIATFERNFRTATVDLALTALNQAERVCQRFLYEVKEAEATLHWNEKAAQMIGQLDPIRSPLTADLEKLDKAINVAGVQMAGARWDRPAFEQANARLQSERQKRREKLDLVGTVLTSFPFVSWPDFPREELLRSTDSAKVMYLVSWYLIEHIAAVQRSRELLNSHSDWIYKLDSLLNASEQHSGIAKGSIFDLVIQNEVEEASKESLLDEIKTAVLFALMIVSIFASGGVGVAAAAGMAALSADQAIDTYKKYVEEHAAYQANLKSTDPSEVWVVIAIIGAGLDAKGAIDLLDKLPALRRAIQSFNAAGKSEHALEALSKDLDKISDLDAATRDAIEHDAESQAAKGARTERAGSESAELPSSVEREGAPGTLTKEPGTEAAPQDLSDLNSASPEAREVSVAQSSHLEEPNPQQLRNEMDEVTDHPELTRSEGKPPRRHRKLGDDWEEVAEGEWCRLSKKKCVRVRRGMKAATKRARKATYSAGSARPGPGQTLVGSSREQMRSAAAKIILGQDDHPLKFLFTKSGEWKSQRLRQHSRLIDRPDIVEMGHIRSGKLGEPDRIMIQGAWENQVANISIEHPTVGGAVLGYGEEEVISIGGIAVHRPTAQFWEDIGWLKPGTVENAPIVQ